MSFTSSPEELASSKILATIMLLAPATTVCDAGLGNALIESAAAFAVIVAKLTEDDGEAVIVLFVT